MWCFCTLGLHTSLRARGRGNGRMKSFLRLRGARELAEEVDLKPVTIKNAMRLVSRSGLWFTMLDKTMLALVLLCSIK